VVQKKTIKKVHQFPDVLCLLVLMRKKNFKQILYKAAGRPVIKLSPVFVSRKLPAAACMKT
jgi:hypothetical protein